MYDPEKSEAFLTSLPARCCLKLHIIPCRDNQTTDHSETYSILLRTWKGN